MQVLRYNKTKAYIPHLDYLESIPGSSHDFASEASGSNRYVAHPQTKALLNHERGRRK